jgi:putative ABC transport system ATP-binding protein
MARLALEKVSVTVRGPHGPLPVLRDVSLEIDSGGTIVIVGPSGAGKTTLLNVVGGLEPEHQGRVLLDGAAVWSAPEPARAAVRNRRIGFVFQEANLIEGLTAEENLSIPLLVRSDSTASDRHVRAREILREIGLEERMTTRVERLSGGERQRVATARALISEPDVILADEPTGNLDEESARRVIDLLLRYRHEQGAILLAATHDTELIRQADRVCALRDGKFDVVR